MYLLHLATQRYAVWKQRRKTLQDGRGKQSSSKHFLMTVQTGELIWISWWFILRSISMGYQHHGIVSDLLFPMTKQNYLLLSKDTTEDEDVSLIYFWCILKCIVKDQNKSQTENFVCLSWTENNSLNIGIYIYVNSDITH